MALHENIADHRLLTIADKGIGAAEILQPSLFVRHAMASRDTVLFCKR